MYNIVQIAPLTEASHRAHLAQASQSVVVLVDTQTHAVSPWHMPLPVGCCIQLLLAPFPK